jgi:hypothetical protein
MLHRRYPQVLRARRPLRLSWDQGQSRCPRNETRQTDEFSWTSSLTCHPSPDHPLQDIFTFILTLLSQQLTPSRASAAGGRAAIPPVKNEFYKQYYYLIESMSTCKSVILMLDTEENEEEMGGREDSLVTRMFKEFFDLVRSVHAVMASEVGRVAMPVRSRDLHD